jgi:hypothetical protein
VIRRTHAGHLPVCESPSADGGMGSRACPEIPPDSIGATPPSSHDLGSRACPEIPPDSTDVMPISTPTSGTCGKHSANMDPEAGRDDRSGTIPGHASPSHVNDAEAGGDDRSGTIPGHASPSHVNNAGYDYAPTYYYASCADHFPQTTMPGSSTSMNQPIT